MRIQNTIIAILLAGAFTYAHAQWLNYPDARTPRTKDGKPNLTAPVPRLNGKPACPIGIEYTVIAIRIETPSAISESSSL